MSAFMIQYSVVVSSVANESVYALFMGYGTGSTSSKASNYHVNIVSYWPGSEYRRVWTLTSTLLMGMYSVWRPSLDRELRRIGNRLAMYVYRNKIINNRIEWQ